MHENNFVYCCFLLFAFDFDSLDVVEKQQGVMLWIFCYRYGCEYILISGLRRDWDIPSDYAMRKFRSCLKPVKRMNFYLDLHVFMYVWMIMHNSRNVNVNHDWKLLNDKLLYNKLGVADDLAEFDVWYHLYTHGQCAEGIKLYCLFEWAK